VSPTPIIVLANKPTYPNWLQHNSRDFWGEIAPCDHVVQIYSNENVVLQSLEGFAGGAFASGESVIVIAVQSRIDALTRRLAALGHDVDALRAADRFIAVDANETLSKFMVNGWPDEARFIPVVKSLMARARGTSNRRVRAYGEMVAILWSEGHNGATVQLEHLWNAFCATESFCLFCAYPKSGFTTDIQNSIRHICATHTKVIAGDVSSATEVFYKVA